MAQSKLVPPHGGVLKPLLLEGDALKKEMERAKSLPKINMTSRERDDLIMMGIGAFSPLDGFMGKADWKGCCDDMKLSNGIFWPIPITLSVTKEVAETLKDGSDAALYDEETGELMGVITVQEKYTIDKVHECKQVFKTDDKEHPGVAKVIDRKSVV